MNRYIFILLVCCGSLSTACLSSTTAAEFPKALQSSAERAAIQHSLEHSPEFLEATKGKKKIIASTMLQLKERPPGANTEHSFVEALHFDYDDGKTVRSLFDQTAEKVVKVEVLEAYPTPLAAQEIEEAKKLAKEKDAKTKKLFENYTEAELATQTLAPVVSDKKNKLYGKRLAILFISPKNNRTAAVSTMVNLTDGTVTSR